MRSSHFVLAVALLAALLPLPTGDAGTRTTFYQRTINVHAGGSGTFQDAFLVPGDSTGVQLTLDCDNGAGFAVAADTTRLDAAFGTVAFVLACYTTGGASTAVTHLPYGHYNIYGSFDYGDFVTITLTGVPIV
jgi:hypothetical protein